MEAGIDVVGLGSNSGTYASSGAFPNGATTIKSIPLQHATHSKALRYRAAHLSPWLGPEYFIPPGRVPTSLLHLSLPSNYQPIAIPDQLLLHKLASSSVSQQRSQTLHGLCGHLVWLARCPMVHLTGAWSSPLFLSTAKKYPIATIFF